MMTSEMIKRVQDVAESLYWDYAVIGIRWQDEEFALGPIGHCSHVWDDGNDTGVELDGICVQDVKTLEHCRNDYYGDHIAIIAGNTYTYGEDPGEVILEDAVVVDILA